MHLIWLQFDDIGSHGTKIIIYNLWYSDDGSVELDFDTDPQVETSFSLFMYIYVYVCIYYFLYVVYNAIILYEILWLGVVGYSYWWGY